MMNILDTYGTRGSWTTLDIRERDIPDVWKRLTFGRESVPDWMRIEDLGDIASIWLTTILPTIHGHREIICWAFEAALLRKSDSFVAARRDGQPWRMTWDDFEQLALDAGVDAMVEAFLAGMPYDDIVLDEYPMRIAFSIHAYARETETIYDWSGRRILFT